MNPLHTDGGVPATRRQVLAAGAAGGAIVSAGCLGTRDGGVPEPQVADRRIDEEWRIVDESSGVVFEETVGPVTVRALEHTIVYEYVDLAEALAETLDASGSPVIFFATRLDVRPAVDRLPGGLLRDRVMEEVRPAAEAAFREQLETSGLENVEVVEHGTVEVISGHTATTARVTADFPIAGQASFADGVSGQVDDHIGVEARLALWHDGTDVLLSGGAYPTEPLSGTLMRAVPTALNGDEIVDEIVEGDETGTLGAEPERFSDAVDALLVAVE